MAKLSVIICVYNTDEKFFEECLNSVFSSTLKDLEVIVVDDGSSKDYSKIIKKFSRVKFVKTENQGTLKARILGVKTATSPYVCFVDSDDTVSFNFFEASLKVAEKKQSDIVFNDWAFQTEQTKYVCVSDSTIGSKLNLSGDEPLKRFVKQAGGEHSYYVLWNKIFKKEILLYSCEKIEELNLDRMVFAEDVLLTYFAFSKAVSASNVHMGYYFYRVHGSQQIAVESEEKLKNHIDAMTAVFDIVEEDLKLQACYEDVKNYFQDWKQLLCANNYQVAKHMKFKGLYGYILDKYKTCKLKKPRRGHDKAYTKQQILPANIDEIDTQLKKVYYSNKYLKVYVKNGTYAKNALLQMKKLFGKNFDFVSTKKQATFVISKQKVSVKQKILHNYFVYKVGMALFPKGSKVRKFLKSKL